MYLGYAPPYHLYQNPKAKSVLDQIVEDQKRTIDRLGTLILDNSGTIDYGEFPMSFTSLHDLSLPYLLKLLIERQQKQITASEKLADALSMSRQPLLRTSISTVDSGKPTASSHSRNRPMSCNKANPANPTNK